MATVNSFRKSVKRFIDEPAAATKEAVAAVNVPDEITADVIATYQEIVERRRELQRQADAISEIQSVLADRIMTFVAAKTKRNRRKATTVGGFLLALVDGGRYPKWKQEFIRVAGEVAAAEVIEQTTPSQKLEITRV